jgi:GTP-binding protein
MKFLDQAKIHLKSGNGGPGCLSFRHEKNLEFGGPDGGNGGRGGDVIFVAVKNLNTLIDFRYTQHFLAKNGEHGKGKLRSGENGSDMIIKVPVGTEILAEDGETVLADMTVDGQTITLLKGGDGGFGNAHYKSATNQAPRKSTPGWPGAEMDVWLRLKLIADAGIIGLPNAGKSTFLAACSAAKPKIADYPFTTLHPNLGVVKIDDFSFVLADIPGLIEGAHEGRGLGDQFLGHVERTAVLLHLIDINSEDVCATYDVIRNELYQYGAGLDTKAEVIALNKADTLLPDEAAEKVAVLAAHTGAKIHLISGVTGQDVRAVLFALKSQIESARAEPEVDRDPLSLNNMASGEAVDEPHE